MGSHRAAIIDISSDEEEDPGLDKMDPVPCSHPAEMFDHADGRRGEDCNDARVVDELTRPAKRRKRDSCPLALGEDDGSDGDDDDCLVLDADPDKPDLVDSDKCDDDLLIVAEKGKLACRDYAHPRHHCANFPFSSSPHEKYCYLCYCYVCDSPAPCNYWGNGNLRTDHCHSTDKGRWQTLRRAYKKRKMAATLPQILTRSHSLRTCSADSISIPNAISQGNQYQPNIVSYQNRRFVQQSTKSSNTRRRTRRRQA